MAAFLVALFDAGALAGALEAVEGGAATMANMLLLDEKVRERANDWRYVKGCVECRAKLYASDACGRVWHTRQTRRVFVDR